MSVCPLLACTAAALYPGFPYACVCIYIIYCAYAYVCRYMNVNMKMNILQLMWCIAHVIVSIAKVYRYIRYRILLHVRI